MVVDQALLRRNTGSVQNSNAHGGYRGADYRRITHTSAETLRLNPNNKILALLTPCAQAWHRALSGASTLIQEEAETHSASW
jgi:hypothetical protein